MVKTLNAQVINFRGQPTPFSSDLSYERSTVAVPFGGCVEPSNVTAGGKACPIRFQCPGCGFYRPDPSYLHAIEQHLNDLRAERETALAMGAAEYVITGITSQITAYQDIASVMRRRLLDLPADERTEIEEASSIMRKARAATAGKVLLPLPTTVRPAASKQSADG